MGIRTCLILCLSSLLVACGGGSSSSPAQASAASVLSVSPSPGTTNPGGSITIAPTGGTAPYTFTQTVAFGTLSLPSGNYTVYTAPSADGVATIQITDSAGNSLTYYVDVTGVVTATTLQISPTNTSVAINGSVPFSANGGTPPYTYSVLTGGGSFSSNVYTAPGAAVTATVEVTDSLGATSQTSVYVGTAAPGSGVSCEGNYTVNVAGVSGSLSVVEDSSGNIGGILLIESYYFPVVGTCSVSGSTGTVSFTNAVLGETYTGTVSYSGTQVSMTGSLASGGVNYSWSATPQSNSTTIPAGSQTCEGSYTADIDGTLGTMKLISDGSNLIGQMILPYQGQNYYYALSGTCSVTAGTISFTDLTTGSTYTGSIGIVGGTKIDMSGTFSEQGTSYGWSAQ